MAVGIVIAAFVMAMFFTPAMTAWLGRRVWWPGKLPVPTPVGESQPRELAPAAEGS